MKSFPYLFRFKKIKEKKMIFFPFERTKKQIKYFFETIVKTKENEKEKKDV